MIDGVEGGREGGKSEEGIEGGGRREGRETGEWRWMEYTGLVCATKKITHACSACTSYTFTCGGEPVSIFPADES